MDEFAFLDATALADLVRRKEVQPAELVETAIRRIEQLNPKLNAVVTPMFEEALATARGDLPEGPFTGVPFLLKDLIAAYKGVRMTMGTSFLPNFIPDHDSELVQRHKRAGLIIVGKTNTPEFGILPTTESRFLGPARNPWDTNRTTGGSSGGSAAAVAVGMVPMAHANDGGGSIRIPAACCGVFGLKPTRARNPLGPDFGDLFSGLIVEHAVTRSVRDSAALLDATAGPQNGDPYWAPSQERPFVQEVGVHPGKLRIAFTSSSPDGNPIHPDCKKAVEQTAKLCQDLGHEIIEANLPGNDEMLVKMFLTLWSAGCAATIDGVAFATGQRPQAEYFEPLTWALYQQGRSHTAAEYVLALQWLQAASRKIAQLFEVFDVLLTPTTSEPPVQLGWFDNPLTAFERASAFVPFTPLCNMTGQPAMSVPLFQNEAGLPIGSHFIGRFGDEATLFRLAAQLEEAAPWAGRQPLVQDKLPL